MSTLRQGNSEKMVGVIHEITSKLTSLDQNLQKCIYVSFEGGQSFLKKVVCKTKEKKKKKLPQQSSKNSGI